MTRLGSELALGPGQERIRLGYDLLSRSIMFANVGLKALRLLPELTTLHWFEPLAPWNPALTYLLRSGGVKSYMTIFSVHKRYPAHYRLFRTIVAGLEKIVVTTEGIGQLLSKVIGVDRQRIVRIPLGVDLELYKPCANKPEAKRRLGIITSHRVFSWFGPIEPSTPRDFHCVFNAARLIHERFPATCFVFAFKNRIPAGIRVRGSWMQFYQDLRDIRGILDATDAVVLPFSRPSWQKGLPLTIVEALASGVPVITTSHGGLDETITDGFNGVLIQDPEDVCEAVLSLCEAEDSLSEMSRHARLVAEQQFDLQGVAQAYLRLWGG